MSDHALWLEFVTNVTMGRTRVGASFVGDQELVTLTIVKNVPYSRRTGTDVPRL